MAPSRGSPATSPHPQAAGQRSPSAMRASGALHCGAVSTRRGEGHGEGNAGEALGAHAPVLRAAPCVSWRRRWAPGTGSCPGASTFAAARATEAAAPQARRPAREKFMR